MAAIVFNPADEVFERLLNKTPVKDVIPDLTPLSREDFQRLLDLLSDEYHNSQPVIADEEFDLLDSIFKTRYGPNVKVGSPPRKEPETKKAEKASKAKASSSSGEMIVRPSGARVQEAKLPIPMFGLDKPNDDRKLELYRKRYPDASFVVTDKLDGCAAELELGPTSFLIKRGTEETGSDISYLLPYLDLPKVKAPIMVRVELVMPTATYEEKYADEYKNPRNMVAGITNAKTIEASKIRDLHVVAFHIY
jgi:NAD-dependent DNA ligase